MLSVFLVLAFVANAGAIVLLLSTAAAMKKTRAHMDPEAAAAMSRALRPMLFAGAVSVARLVCLIGIWSWKRWAFYGYLSTSALGVVLSMRTAGKVAFAVHALLLAVLALQLVSKREQFD